MLSELKDNLHIEIIKTMKDHRDLYEALHRLVERLFGYIEVLEIENNDLKRRLKKYENDYGGNS
jgi:regulator of replication initiation timing